MSPVELKKSPCPKSVILQLEERFISFYWIYKYILEGSILEKCGKIWKNSHFPAGYSKVGNLFHPRFVCPILTALYHPARIRVDFTDIIQILQEGDILEKQSDISENGVISVKKKDGITCLRLGHAPFMQEPIRIKH